MKIGILCAIAEEGRHILQEMRVTKTVDRLKTRFYEGTFDGTAVVMVIGGMGKVSSALCTHILLNDFQADLVIFAGIAGGLNRELTVGDTVIGTETLYHDVDRAGQGIDLNTLYSFFRNRFQTDPALIELLRGHLPAQITLPGSSTTAKIHFGRILTGDQVITSSVRVRQLREDLEGDCVEMEGAAVAQTCTLNERPFLLIRTISDLADEDAMQTVEASMDRVVEINYLVLKSILMILGKNGAEL